MSRSLSEVLDLLQQRFPDGEPTDEHVLRQGGSWYPRHWSSRWPTELQRPIELESVQRAALDRKAVFEVTRTATSDTDILRGFLLMGAWGTGSKAQRVARVAKALHQPNLLDSLRTSAEMAREGDAVDAFAFLNARNEGRIKHLGPAFFTKWLYFTGYKHDETTARRPLILDARVASTLGWRTTGWASSTYGEYLDLAEQVRRAWCPQASTHVVEYALFSRPQVAPSRG